jgi:hypothetical protein
MARSKPLGPAPEIAPVSRVHAQHGGNHDDRQRRGKGFDQIKFAFHRIQQFVGHRRHLRSHRLDGAGVEGVGDQPAQAGVIGIIEHQHGTRRLPILIGGEALHDGVGRGIALIDRQAAILQHGRHIGRAGEQHAAQHLVFMHRISGPQRIEAFVRAIAEHFVENGHLKAGGQAHSPSPIITNRPFSSRR